MKLTVTNTPLPGVLLIDTVVYEDDRGFFLESWNARDFAAAGLDVKFVQESHSRSRRGVVRGLHYQDARAPLGKLVRCTVGRIFDVAVDLRPGTETFGKWIGVELSAENRRQLYVPEGCAHGFQALTDVAEVQYRQTGLYAPDAEGTLLWNDPDLAIDWPIADAILSDRDRQGQPLRAYLGAPAF